MKINKIIIRIAHLFGFRRDEEHIDDITIDVYLSKYDHYLDVDINTMTSKEVFKGGIFKFTYTHVLDYIVCEFEGIGHMVLSYDVVRDIDSRCYIRTIEEMPG